MLRRLLYVVLTLILVWSVPASAWAQIDMIRITFDGNRAYLDELGQTFSQDIDYPAGEIDPADFPTAFLEAQIVILS